MATFVRAANQFSSLLKEKNSLNLLSFFWSGGVDDTRWKKVQSDPILSGNRPLAKFLYRRQAIFQLVQCPDTQINSKRIPKPTYRIALKRRIFSSAYIFQIVYTFFLFNQILHVGILVTCYSRACGFYINLFRKPQPPDR